MEITECPKDRSQWTQTFDIYPVGLTEKLSVTLELQCECDCEAPELEVNISSNSSLKMFYSWEVP